MYIQVVLSHFWGLKWRQRVFCLWFSVDLLIIGHRWNTHSFKVVVITLPLLHTLIRVYLNHLLIGTNLKYLDKYMQSRWTSLPLNSCWLAITCVNVCQLNAFVDIDLIFWHRKLLSLAYGHRWCGWIVIFNLCACLTIVTLCGCSLPRTKVIDPPNLAIERLPQSRRALNRTLSFASTIDYIRYKEINSMVAHLLLSWPTILPRNPQFHCHWLATMGVTNLCCDSLYLLCVCRAQEDGRATQKLLTRAQ